MKLREVMTSRQAKPDVEHHVVELFLLQLTTSHHPA
jgi:hypothetical protein